MNYLSVCSGIAAETVAWEPLGFTAAAYSETGKFPSAVLAHHYPHTPNLGDLTEHEQWKFETTPDVLVGGTPCQSFSKAGQRGGMADRRGNLAMEFCRVADTLRPRWVVWENVPGVFTSDNGQAFRAIIAALTESGYGVCWRVLDAIAWLPQRRKRVFVVGYLGAWQPAAGCLFDPESGGWNPAAGENKSRRATGGTQTKPDGAGGLKHTSSLRSHAPRDRADLLIENPPPNLYRHKARGRYTASPTHAAAQVKQPPRSRGDIVAVSKLRYLTPLECERLMGLPDCYTLIPWRGKPPENCPKTLRYEAVGNSIAVPVLRWIGRRIKILDRVMTP